MLQRPREARRPVIGVCGFQSSEESTGWWWEGDRARTSRRLGRKAVVGHGLVRGQEGQGKLSGMGIRGMGRGQQVGKITVQEPPEEVGRRVTGRISKDPETSKRECMGGQEGKCRGTGWPLSRSERTGSGWRLRVGWAGSDWEGCTVVPWREPRALEMPREHPLPCTFLFSSSSESDEMAESGQQVS